MNALAVLMAATAVQSGYPVTEVLSEFRLICLDQPSMAAIGDAASKNGWKSIDPSAEPRVSKVVSAGKVMLAKLNVIPETATYSKTTSGRTLSLVVFRGTVPFNGAPKPMTNCNIYDFDAAAPLDANVVSGWAGRKPTNIIIQGGLQAMEWAPGLSPRLPSKSRIGFVPNTPQFRSQPVHGIALVSNTFEEEK